MWKLGKRKRKSKSKSSTTPESQVESKAVAPGEGENGTLAACIKRPRTEDKYYSASTSNTIPTEILFNILLLLPASILQDIVRFVCKEWNAIISDPLFVRAHIRHSLSSPGLAFLVQDNDLHDAKLKRAFYLHTNDNATRYSWIELKLPFKAAILGCCNGLVLLHNVMDRRELFVVNLITKANISLPPLKLAGVRVLCKPDTTLAFAPSSGQYKAVYVSFVSNNKRAPYVHPSEVEVLSAKFEVKVMVCTVAVDKTWRTIDFKDITMSDVAKRTLMSQPLSSAGGYIYWFLTGYNYGLALDIDAETMYQVTAPKDYLMNFCAPYSVKMDTGSVGMVLLQSHDKHWKVWELIEPKTDTWGRQAMDFDAACMYSALKSYFNPCSVGSILPLLFSLKTGELWLICGSGGCSLVCYNWKTGNIWSPPIRWPRFRPLPHLYVNSLLSLKNI